MQLLVAYDGSVGAGRALERVAAIAGEHDQVTIISVVPSFEQALALSDRDRDDHVRLRETQAAVARRTLFERGVPARTVVLVGDPAHVICETAAREACDLIVVGTRHLHGVGRVAHRSVSTDVVHRAPCDVLVVH